MLPLTYKTEKSIDVKEETELFIKNNNSIEKDFYDYFWLYHAVGGLVPHTFDNMFSGHFAPFVDSFEELQVSYNLMLFGFYKQAIVSLRGVLELGMLSVFWNLYDNGHEDIKEWHRSKENTPRFEDIWNKISKHENFKILNNKINFKKEILKLSDLHNYVHTKGYKYTNSMGKMKSNCQTFEESSFIKYYQFFKSVIYILTILHLVKYPLGVYEYDFSKKFGIDTPGFPQLHFSIDKLKKIIGKEIYSLILDILNKDSEAQNVIVWINSLPDMTEEDVNNQIFEYDIRDIEHHGFKVWYLGNKSIIKMKESSYFYKLYKYSLDNDVFDVIGARKKQGYSDSKIHNIFIENEKEFDLLYNNNFENLKNDLYRNNLNK
ncbi:MAG: hypothetical protein PHI37_04595 [Candidatus Gracilibacteria bacterium]|nr:hypothetical protein [Candidatus Gracilibacteria bacterium]